MTYGLKDDDLNAIRLVFRNHPEIEKAILYGSRAKGTYKPASDIDLTLQGELLNSTLLNKISWELDDLLLPVTFDLSVFAQISNPDLVDHIKRVGVLFYSKDN